MQILDYHMGVKCFYATRVIFLLQGASVETANQCGGRKKTSFAKK